MYLMEEYITMLMDNYSKSYVVTSMNSKINAYRDFQSDTSFFSVFLAYTSNHLNPNLSSLVHITYRHHTLEDALW